MKNLFKVTALSIATLLSCATAQADELGDLLDTLVDTNVWSCSTKDGGAIIFMETRGGDPILRYSNVKNNVEEYLPDPRPHGISEVTSYFGEQLYPTGDVKYYRLEYLAADGNMESWVILDGEIRGSAFQGIRMYSNGKRIASEECDTYVSSGLKGYSAMYDENESDLEAYGSID